MLSRAVTSEQALHADPKRSSKPRRGWAVRLCAWAAAPAGIKAWQTSDLTDEKDDEMHGYVVPAREGGEPRFPHGSSRDGLQVHMEEAVSVQVGELLGDFS